MQTFELKVLTLDESGTWKRLIESTGERDVYFLPSYFKIWEKNYKWKAYMVFYGNGRNFVIYPFFKKIIKLPFLEDEPQAYDIISPEFFCGPLIKSDDNLKADLSDGFLREFHAWCLKNNIVTEFARLHPFIKNDLIFPPETVVKLYNIVWLDLTADYDVIWKNFEKSCRNAIVKAKKEKVEVIVSDKKSDIDDFYSLYINSMKRLNASEKYFHTKEFFEDFFKIMKDNVSLFLAKYEGKTIAAALFIHAFGFFHYFRACSDREFSHKNPNNMILFEAINWAKKMGYKVFTFGGAGPGHGNDLNDNLFRFKASFSKSFITVTGRKEIHNNNLYKLFCEKKEKYLLQMGINDNAFSYFPEYQIKHFPEYRIKYKKLPD